jgi:hypothetical protein
MSTPEDIHVPAPSIGHRHADVSKAFVMRAIQALVDTDLAEWHPTEDGELELTLTTGETFIVRDAGITATRETRQLPSTTSTNRRCRSMR